VNRRALPILIVVVVLATISMSAFAHPARIAGSAYALVRVPIPTGAELSRFGESGLPVFARLAGQQGDYILTGGDTAHLRALTEKGLPHEILDPDMAGGSFYIVTTGPAQSEPDWESYGSLLFDDGRQIILRAAEAQVERLVLSGAQVQKISLSPKPLYPSGEPHRFPIVIDPDPVIQAMIDQVTTPQIEDLTGGLSGEWPVTIGGSAYTIATRYTYSGTPIQKATQYAGERLAALGLDVQFHQWGGATYPNVIGELPGQVNPDEIYIIGGHLDDMPSGPLAPGADDNASGSVATLLAADILSQYSWGCTLRFALWTGEEQGLLGSEAYAQQAYNDDENIIGYLNLDMIAWNNGGSSPGIDLHANSSLPATLTLAQLFADVVAAYELDLVPQIVPNGTGASDHASFWQYGYTAILGIEDFGDFNPYYHTTADDMDNFEDWPYYTDFVKASLATFAHMTGCLIQGGMGYLDGTVSAETGGAPVPDALVTAEDAQGQTFSALTDASGYYTQTLAAGTYTVTAAAFGYLPAPSVSIEILTDTVTTRDFQLTPIAEIQINPGSLTATILQGATVTTTLEIDNLGAAALTWILEELPAAEWLSVDPSAGQVPPGGTAVVTVSFDGLGLAEGQYTTTLRLTSNDPDDPVLEIPVVLEVIAPEWQLFLPLIVFDPPAGP
jgi:hypothetical protein